MATPDLSAPARSKDALVVAVQGFARMVANGRAVETVFRRSGIDLTGADIHLLYTIHGARGGIRLGDLAERLVVDAPTVTRRVQQLESRQLLQRQSDPADKRAQLVRLTAAGTRLLIRGIATYHQWLETVLASWSQDDRDQLATLLERFTNDICGEIGCHGR